MALSGYLQSTELSKSLLDTESSQGRENYKKKEKTNETKRDLVTSDATSQI
jgi:hypothetical protein